MYVIKEQSNELNKVLSVMNILGNLPLGSTHNNTIINIIININKSQLELPQITKCWYVALHSNVIHVGLQAQPDHIIAPFQLPKHLHQVFVHFIFVCLGVLGSQTVSKNVNYLEVHNDWFGKQLQRKQWNYFMNWPQWLKGHR